MNKFKSNLDYFIRESGLTINQVARKSNTDRAFFYKDNYDIFCKLPKIAEVLNISVDDFFIPMRKSDEEELEEFERGLNNDSVIMSSFFGFLKRNRNVILKNYVWGEV